MTDTPDLNQVLDDLVADWEAQAARWAGTVPQGVDTGWHTGPPPSAHELLSACADQLAEVRRTGEMPVMGLPGQVTRLCVRLRGSARTVRARICWRGICAAWRVPPVW
jgi:hypothetical protein